MFFLTHIFGVMALSAEPKNKLYEMDLTKLNPDQVTVLFMSAWSITRGLPEYGDLDRLSPFISDRLKGELLEKLYQRDHENWEKFNLPGETPSKVYGLEGNFLSNRVGGRDSFFVFPTYSRVRDQNKKRFVSEARILYSMRGADISYDEVKVKLVKTQANLWLVDKFETVKGDMSTLDRRDLSFADVTTCLLSDYYCWPAEGQGIPNRMGHRWLSPSLNWEIQATQKLQESVVRGNRRDNGDIITDNPQPIRFFTIVSAEKLDAGSKKAKVTVFLGRLTINQKMHGHYATVFLKLQEGTWSIEDIEVSKNQSLIKELKAIQAGFKR